MTKTAFAISEAQMKRLFVLMLALAAVALLLMMPEFAIAQETGDGTAGYWGEGASDIREQSDRSFREWWDVASTWMLWIGLGVLAATVIFFKGTGWYLALIIWGIAAWGDKIVDWVSAL